MVGTQSNANAMVVRRVAAIKMLDASSMLLTPVGMTCEILADCGTSLYAASWMTLGLGRKSAFTAFAFSPERIARPSW